MIKKYLENSICDFELLFDIDYNKKVNILSTCFFKMGAHYKNFNIYVNGLKRLINSIEKQSDYKLRIFIDSHIKNDKEIFPLLKASKSVQIVVFKCSNYYKDNYHIDVFGALVRLFPVFDFPNNDAKNVITIDIDLNQEDMKSLMIFLKYDTKKAQIVGKGTTQVILVEKKLPHFFLGLCGFYNKKYSSNIITDFIINAHNIKDKGIYGKRIKTFGYGTDELFLNEYFIYKDEVTIKTELGILFDYDINWFLFYYKPDLLVYEPQLTNKYLNFILEDYKKPNSSIEQMFHSIDKSIYKVPYSDEKKLFITKKFYMLIKQLLSKSTEWFDLDNMKLIDKYYHNIIECTSIVFFDMKTNIINIKNLNIKKI